MKLFRILSGVIVSATLVMCLGSQVIKAQSFKNLSGTVNRDTGNSLLSAVLVKHGKNPIALDVLDRFDVDPFVLADIVQTGRLEISNSQERDFFYKTVLPLAQLVDLVNNKLSRSDAIGMGILTSVRQAREDAGLIMQAIGQTSYSQAPNPMNGAGSGARRIGACKIGIRFGDFADQGMLILPGSDNNFGLSSSKLGFMNGGRTARVDAADFVIADSTCGSRPDANNKCCNDNSDPLANDTCTASTGEYCNVTRQHGYDVCSASSDEC